MFQIVLYENYKKIKVLHTYTRLYDANNRLKILNSKETYLPKKFIYRDKKLTEVNYKIFLFKRKEEGDKSILIRDNFGKIITQSNLDLGIKNALESIAKLGNIDSIHLFYKGNTVLKSEEFKIHSHWVEDPTNERHLFCQKQ